VSSSCQRRIGYKGRRGEEREKRGPRHLIIPVNIGLAGRREKREGRGGGKKVFCVIAARQACRGCWRERKGGERRRKKKKSIGSVLLLHPLKKSIERAREGGRARSSSGLVASFSPSRPGTKRGERRGCRRRRRFAVGLSSPTMDLPEKEKGEKRGKKTERSLKRNPQWRKKNSFHLLATIHRSITLELRDWGWGGGGSKRELL